MENFNNAIAEILEVDNVNMNDELTSFECWDSLTILSIIALAEEKYGKQLTNESIREAKTIGGLMKLLCDE